MIITYLRSSSYGRYSFCELFYYFEYVLGYRDDEAKVKTVLGSMTHKVLEMVALSSLAEKKGESSFFEDETGKTCLVKDYDSFIQHAFEYYKGKSKHEYGPNELKQVKKWFKTAMNSELNPEKLDLIAPEQKFDFIIEKPWAYYKFGDIEGYLGLKGTMDFAFRKDGLINIGDYKTGRRVDWNKAQKNRWNRWDAPTKDYQALCKDPQIRMYYYAACHVFGIQDMIFSIYFIDKDEVFDIALGSNEYEETENMIRERFEHIKNNELPNRIKSNGQLHDRCSWCPHSTDNRVWDAKTKEWKPISTNACDFIYREITKKGTEEVRKLYGIDGAFSEYGDGGGRSAKTD